MLEIRFKNIDINSNRIIRCFAKFDIEFNYYVGQHNPPITQFGRRYLFANDDFSIKIGYSFRTSHTLPYTFVSYSERHQDLIVLFRLAL